MRKLLSCVAGIVSALLLLHSPANAQLGTQYTPMWTTSADATNGGTAPSAGTVVMGSDGTAARTLRTDANGNLYVNSSGALQTAGNIASGATDSGFPVKIGGYASVSAPSAVSAGQRVNAWYTVNGASVTAPLSSNPSLGDAAGNSAFQWTDASGNAVTYRSYPYVLNGTTWDRQRSITGSDGTGTGVQAVATAPNSSANGAIAPVSTSAAASSIVIKASAGNLYRLNAVAAASAGYLLVFDAVSAPVDGAVTPKLCLPVAANAGLDWNMSEMPVRFTTGIVVAFSSTGCFTKTASATAFISGLAQ